MNKGKFLSIAAIALTLGSGISGGAFAAGQGNSMKVAQAQPSDIGAAIAAYRQAQADLDAAKTGGGDVRTAERNFKKATTDLEHMCKILDQKDLEQCIAAVTGSAPDATGAAQPSSSSDQDQQPAVVPEPTNGNTVQTQTPAAPVETSGAEAAQPAGETQPAAAEPAPAAAEPVPAAKQSDAAAPSDAPMDQPVVDNPSGTPMPRQLSRAIGNYEQANMRLANAVVGTREAERAQRDVDAALADIQKVCEKAGQAEMNACLAGFGVALSPIAVPLQETAKPETPEVIPPQEVAPVLDSAKDAEKAGAQPPSEQPKAELPPPPDSDAAAQAGAVPETIPSIEDTTGTRVTERPKRDKPPEAQVVEQTGLQIVFQFNNQLIITNQSDSRLSFGATERYVEELPRGRTRETIIRPDGTRLVTVYNRNGDILRRSRFDRDGNEIVLSYVRDDYEQDLLNWRDPGLDLPPLQLNIPQQDYILDADQANTDDLTRFLDQPPVESVRRLYSIDEVKRSARLRDMVRRLEIGNLNFEFGSSAIPPDQIGALSVVANAMLDLIDNNPAETFLIEGHTDAVGSDLSNLILSDSRAQTVAIALTQVFGVPPENLSTQGYGERYLKVNTQAAERLNRRVTIRRITPLVAPETSNFSMN